jgi:predicted metalloprotease with PDZ domain
MNKFLLLICFVLLYIPTSLQAQQAIHYQVTFPNARHHEAEVAVTFTQVPNQPLRVRMSRSSPGRYATHEFAKNIYHIKATNGQGKPLVLVRIDPDSWEIPFPEPTVKVTYTLFGNLTDGTYTDIDVIHAHLNMPATLLWAKGWEKQPITVSFLPPAHADWKVATQLKPTEKPYTFTAPDLQYLMDSPTELSKFSVREWSVPNPEQQAQTLRLALHHDGTEKDVDEYVEMVKRVVLEEKAIYGELPVFDFGTYTFIQDVLPGNDRDGMEHRNSTIITQDASIRDIKEELLGTVSHEFFHTWNVERIRPKSLEPFNFEQANMSSELWFAEGFTTYYGELVLARAGFHNVEKFAQVIGGQLSGVLNSPATHAFSPVEMSRHAPFADAATAVDPTNFANVFMSYYPYGSAIGLALDLTLRSRFKNLTLDDYMRAVWQAHGKSETPYSLTDLEQVLGSVTGDTAFATAFFRKHILGPMSIDYVPLLAKAGLLLRKARPGTAFLGQQVGIEDGKVLVVAGTLIGTPLYAAGLDKGDIILSIDHASINNADDYRAVLRKYKPGKTVPIRFVHRGTEQEASLTFAEDPQLELVPYEKTSKTLTKEMKAFRDSWLGSKAAE